MSNNNDDNVFHPYPSTSLLRGMAYASTTLIFIIAIVVAGTLLATKQVLFAVLTVIGGIIVAILSIAWILVFLNMSDDLKLLGEEMCELRRQLLQHEKNTLVFYDATNKIMQSQLGELEDINDRQEKTGITGKGNDAKD